MSSPTVLRVTLDGERTYEIEVRQVDGRTIARVDGRDVVVELRDGLGPGGVGGLVDGRPMELGVRAGDLSTVFVPGGRPLRVDVSDGASFATPGLSVPTHAQGPCDVTSPITGIVAAVIRQPGAMVQLGDPLVLVEAMKMENRILAPRAGCVLHVAVAQGDLVRPGQVLARVGAVEAP